MAQFSHIRMSKSGWEFKKNGIYEFACDATDAVNTSSISSDVINCNERDFYFSTAATLGSIWMNAFTFPLGATRFMYFDFDSNSISTSTTSKLKLSNGSRSRRQASTQRALTLKDHVASTCKSIRLDFWLLFWFIYSYLYCVLVTDKVEVYISYS